MKLLTLLFTILALQTQAQINYINYQSPVKSQHGRGTCSAFSLLSAMEVLPGFPTDLSEQHAYALAKAKLFAQDSSGSYQEGATFPDYLDLLDEKGIVREDQMPYNPYLGFWASANNSFAAYNADVSGATVDEILGQKTFSYTLEKDYCIYKTSGMSSISIFLQPSLEL